MPRPTGPGSMPRWTPEEVATLRWIYPDKSNADVARLLGRTVKAVLSKAAQLGLRKSSERLREMGEQNVRGRYQ